MERHPGGLSPRIGFIAADLQGKPGNAVGFCNKRGVADSWIKEGKYALTRSRLFRTRFSSSRARLSLFVPACNLSNFLRRFALPGKAAHRSPRSIRLKLKKTGAKVMSRSRRTVFRRAEGRRSRGIVRKPSFPHPLPCNRSRPTVRKEVRMKRERWITVP